MATIGKVERGGLIAGNYPLEAAAVIVQGPTGTGTIEFKRGDVVALNEDGAPVLVDSAVTGAENAVGIMTDNVVANADEEITTTMYIKGAFNKRYLNFGGTDTADTHIRRMTEIGLIIRETRI